jgi:hypothetical protein
MVWDRIRSRREPEDEVIGDAATTVAEPMPAPMPALVPLTVLDGAQRAPRSGSERILPPT